MLVKTILIFLLAMALVGMIGKALFPNAVRRITGLNRCKTCGKPRIGRAPCTCGGRA